MRTILYADFIQAEGLYNQAVWPVQAITWVLFLLMYCTKTLQAEMICRLQPLPC